MSILPIDLDIAQKPASLRLAVVNPYRTSFSGGIVEKGWSDFHYYEFVQNPKFGLSLFLDGTLQSTEADQGLYHQGLVMPAVRAQPDARDILIIGGAGGGVLHQLHGSIGLDNCQVVVVDIDQKFFQVAAKIMARWGAGELGHSSVEKIFQNGRDYLQKTMRKFDMIIMDVGDPLPHTKSNDVYAAGVLKAAVEKLNPGGVLSFYSAPGIDSFPAATSQSLGQKRNFTIRIPSFEHPWAFNLLKKGREGLRKAP